MNDDQEQRDFEDLMMFLGAAVLGIVVGLAYLFLA